MTGKTSIIAPPYYMRSTAAVVRSGFPYFSHHDSVTALWSKKWRTPCAHGIYPFTDANVEDFDPIFDQLVQASDDNSEILHRPDEYAKPFLPVAEDLVLLAEQAEGQGDTTRARDLGTAGPVLEDALAPGLLQ